MTSGTVHARSRRGRGGFSNLPDSIRSVDRRRSLAILEPPGQLPDRRTLTWVDVWRRQACATVLDYKTDCAFDGVSISESELGRLILGRSGGRDT